MTIDEFQDKVMQLKPNNFMSLNGAGAGIVGATDSGSYAISDLQRACIEFTHLYKTSDVAADVQNARKEVIAKIMVAHTLDAISEEHADDLIEALQALKRERE